MCDRFDACIFSGEDHTIVSIFIIRPSLFLNRWAALALLFLFDCFCIHNLHAFGDYDIWSRPPRAFSIFDIFRPDASERQFPSVYSGVTALSIMSAIWLCIALEFFKLALVIVWMWRFVFHGISVVIVEWFTEALHRHFVGHMPKPHLNFNLIFNQ